MWIPADYLQARLDMWNIARSLIVLRFRAVAETVCPNISLGNLLAEDLIA